MNPSKIEKKYPELLGLSCDKQLEIVKRARQEIHSGRNERIFKFVMVMVIFITFGLIRPLIFPSTFWGKTISAFVPGIICCLVYIWYYGMKCRQKIKELVQAEKQDK